jgi:hypothetical protein
MKRKNDVNICVERERRESEGERENRIRNAGLPLVNQ